LVLLVRITFLPSQAISLQQGTTAVVNFLKPYESAVAKIAAGPMVYWSPVHRDYEVLAVVKRDDQKAVMLPGGEVPKTSLLRGYGIDLVAETITAGSRGTEF
jgi:hypothetical protein